MKFFKSFAKPASGAPETAKSNEVSQDQMLETPSYSTHRIVVGGHARLDAAGKVVQQLYVDPQTLLAIED